MLRCPCPIAPRRLLAVAGLCLGAGLLVAAVLPTEARALVAACADGSVVLARGWRDVHCAGAVEVAPGTVPPMGMPKSLPTGVPQSFRRQLEAARERDIDEQLASVDAAPPPLVSLDATQRRDLARFIELSQAAEAASIEREGGEAPPARMRIAHSRAFESKLRAVLAARGASAPGPILVFSLEPSAAAFADATPAFAQRGVTFRPRSGDRTQLGWLGERLGYLALPAGFELSRPLAIFWGDAVAAAWLQERHSSRPTRPATGPEISSNRGQIPHLDLAPGRRPAPRGRPRLGASQRV